MYTKLLKSFSEIKGLAVPEKETFFDICGYPHYENVASNVLAYFFDPAKPHDLKNTLIQALINVAYPEIAHIDEVWEIEREVRTNKGKYIDILLKSNDYVVIIENKVYADLYNDLLGYYHFVAQQFPNQQILSIVLCLHNPPKENLFGFQIVTYEQLFDKFKIYLATMIDQINLSYIQLLTDFMINMTKLKVGTKMDEKFLQFVSEHNEDLVGLVKKVKIYRDTLRKKVKEVNGLLPEEINHFELKKWEYRDVNQLFDTAVTDIILKNDTKLAIDAILDHTGWHFDIFQRGNQSSLDIVESCIKNGLNGELNNKKFRTDQKYEFNCDPNIVAAYIKNVVEKLTVV